MMNCIECGQPMLARQRVRHYSCCAAIGGVDPICNAAHKPHVDVDGLKYKRCAICWRRGDFVKSTKRAA